MRKKILVIDDSRVVRLVIADSLLKAGYTVIEAVDGEDGIAKVKSVCFDCIITDLNMPRMDGINMIATIKREHLARFVPIIMLTSESDDAKRKLGKAAGASAWLNKPFKPEQLLAIMRMICPPE